MLPKVLFMIWKALLKYDKYSKRATVKEHSTTLTLILTNKQDKDKVLYFVSTCFLLLMTFYYGSLEIVF